MQKTRDALFVKSAQKLQTEKQGKNKTLRVNALSVFVIKFLGAFFKKCNNFFVFSY